MSVSYSADIVAEPKHFNLEFFHDVLENALLRNNFQIHNVEFTMGSSAGENYCSHIYRVNVTFKRLNGTENYDSISFIIKSILQSDGMEFLQDLNVFLKEKIIYSKVLPCLEVLCKDNTKFSARLYHSVKTPNNSLVFEDLTASKYVLSSRENGMNLAHSLLVMRKLGQFHATSKKFLERSPELLDCFQVGLLSEGSLKNDDGVLVQMFIGSINALIELIEQWPGFEQIRQKIKKYAQNLIPNLMRSGAADGDDFKVLNHGDLWVNNMMFKYDKQHEPVDLNFVDFQLSVWNSPGIDLNYFFYTSLEFDVLQNNLEDLKREYHQSLCKSMKELGIEQIPSYEQINNEIQKRQLYGFYASYAIFPFISQDKKLSHDSNFENFRNEQFAKQKIKQLFASKRSEKFFRYTLKQFDKMGIFD